MDNPTWFELSDDGYNEVLRLAKLYRREASRCLKAKAYVAGCTAAGASLEAVLIAMITLHGEEVDKAGCVATYNKKPKPLLKWKFVELQRTAETMGWLSRGLVDDEPWNTRKAKIGDYAVALRQIRNLIHPGRYIRDHSPHRVTRRYLERYTEILDVTAEVLNNKVMKSLKKWIDSLEE